VWASFIAMRAEEEERVCGRVEERLGYVFGDRGLVVEALTHASYRHEADVEASDYERLEFLGDAVVELAVSELLYRRVPDAREGRLTQLRARIVNARTLASVAKELALGELVWMGRGEDQTGGRTRRSILSDLVEALIGAIYLDGGFDAALGVVERLVGPHLDQLLGASHLKDPKSRLQEWSQEHLRVTPTYSVTQVTGPQHDARFEAEVQVGAEIHGIGHGPSKKDAEQSAASIALAHVAPMWRGEGAGATADEGAGGERAGGGRVDPEVVEAADSA